MDWGGSYGFLMLGALIGALNLIFMIFRNHKKEQNVNRIMKEMTQISGIFRPEKAKTAERTGCSMPPSGSPYRRACWAP